MTATYSPRPRKPSTAICRTSTWWLSRTATRRASRRGFPVMVTETAYGQKLGISYEGWPKTSRTLAAAYNVDAFSQRWYRWPEILAVHPVPPRQSRLGCFRLGVRLGLHGAGYRKLHREAALLAGLQRRWHRRAESTLSAVRRCAPDPRRAGRRGDGAGAAHRAARAERECAAAGSREPTPAPPCRTPRSARMDMHSVTCLYTTAGTSCTTSRSEATHSRSRRTATARAVVRSRSRPTRPRPPTSAWCTPARYRRGSISSTRRRMPGVRAAI